MTELKPCPFCGSVDVRALHSYVECNSCKALGPDSTKEATAVGRWNRRAPVVEPEALICEFPGCGKPADYEGWYRRRDPFLGTPTGHIVRIAFCEGCKSHPHLCVNEPRPKKHEQDKSSG